ncbi:uncharacterized protein BJ171DRAFT_80895 [Polychytrium aggregatum]|uniref:uncharacterized protein n=1 Tax=Polychytrium aggregatum TaxID=110093 RepID=UPI0022FE4AF6|nr:uncharacterized protein BJ171DRAFT_80895 [Polychytrium aggregatum]KAI9204970.1 hypothetical protein BJ171DRAFT_80895 [Polychytrium aggregatum]
MNCKWVGRAEYDYDARTEEELTIREGDLLLVLDDSDPDWTSVKELPLDAFKEPLTGLVPTSYIQAAPVVAQATALYDYTALTDDELTFAENARLDIIWKLDEDWWLAKSADGIGLVPFSYVHEDGVEMVQDEAPHEEMSAPEQDDTTHAPAALDQKNQLLSALDGLGFSSAAKPRPAKPASEYAPAGVKLFSVTEIDKKKKKNSRKGRMGISDDYVVYFTSETETVIAKWEFSQVRKFTDKKKKVIIEFSDGVREYEGEKPDIQSLVARLEEIKTRSKISAPILSGPPPTFSGAPVPQAAPSPVVAAPVPPPIAPGPSPASRPTAPVITPSPAALQKSSAPPKIAVALYDYDAQTDEELSIRENDNLMVSDDSDSDWWKVRLVAKGRSGEGLVPATYVQLKQRLDEEQASATASPSPAIVSAAAPVALPPRISVPERPAYRPSLDQEPERLDSMRRQDQANEPISLPQRVPILPSRPPPAAPLVPQRPNIDLPPTIPSRPSLNEPPALPGRPSLEERAPPIPGRPALDSTKRVAFNEAPPMPRRPAEAATAHGDSPRSSQTKNKIARTWTDRTGSFQVEAEYLGVVDGKVHLLKSNGVTIAVALDKLSADDSEFIRTLPGNEFIPAPARATARPTAGQYMVNGFDWKDFLIKAHCTIPDSEKYARIFVEQKMDKSVLPDLDTEVLRALGVSEPDIIRIKKASKPSGGSHDQIPVSDRERMEKEAETRNLQLLDAIRKKETLKSDEEFARTLQGLEAPLSASRRPTRPPGSTINPDTLSQAKDTLLTAQKQASPKSSPHPSRSNSTASGLATLAAASSIKNDPWDVPKSTTSKPLAQAVAAKDTASARDLAAQSVTVSRTQQMAAEAEKVKAQAMAAEAEKLKAQTESLEKAQQTLQALQKQNLQLLAQQQQQQQQLQQQQQQFQQQQQQQQLQQQQQQQLKQQMAALSAPPPMPSLATKPMVPLTTPLIPAPRLGQAPISGFVPTGPPKPVVAPTTLVGNLAPALPLGNASTAGLAMNTSAPVSILQPQHTGSSTISMPNSAIGIPNSLSMGQLPSLQPQTTGDRYSVFKDINVNAPSVFNQPAAQLNAALAQQAPVVSSLGPTRPGGLQPSTSFNSFGGLANSTSSGNLSSLTGPSGTFGGNMPSQALGPNFGGMNPSMVPLNPIAPGLNRPMTSVAGGINPVAVGGMNLGVPMGSINTMPGTSSGLPAMNPMMGVVPGTGAINPMMGGLNRGSLPAQPTIGQSAGMAGMMPNSGLANPGLVGMNPRAPGLTPGIGVVNPQLGGFNPAAAGFNPAAAGFNPATAGMNPMALGVNPANPAMMGMAQNPNAFNPAMMQSGANMHPGFGNNQFGR